MWCARYGIPNRLAFLDGGIWIKQVAHVFDKYQPAFAVFADAASGCKPIPLEWETSIGLTQYSARLIVAPFRPTIHCRHCLCVTVNAVLRYLSAAPPPAPSRSEEHTSELQSRHYLVCR